MDTKENSYNRSRIPARLLITFQKNWVDYSQLLKTRKAHQTFIFEDLGGGLMKVSKCFSRKYTIQVITRANAVRFVVAKFRRNLRKIILTGQYENIERAMSTLIASKRLESFHFWGEVALSVVKRIRAFRMLKDLQVIIPSEELLGCPDLLKEFRHLQRLYLYVSLIGITTKEAEATTLRFFKNLCRLVDLRTLNIVIDSLPEKQNSLLLDVILSTLGNLSVPNYKINTPIAKVDIEQTKEFFSKLDFLHLKTLSAKWQPHAYRGAMRNSQKIGEFFSRYLSVSSLHQILENSTGLKTLCIDEITLLSFLPLKEQNVRCWEGLKSLLVRTERGFNLIHSKGDCLLGLCNFLSEVTGLNNIHFQISLKEKESLESFTKLHQLKCMKSIQSYSLTHNGLIESDLEPMWTDFFKELGSFSDLKSLKLSIHFESFFSLSVLERLLQHLTKLECLMISIYCQSQSIKDKEEINFSIPFDSLPELRIFQLNLTPNLSVPSSQSLLEGLGKLKKIHSIETNNCLGGCPVNILKAKIMPIFKLKSVKKVHIRGITLEKSQGEELTIDSFFNL